MAALTPIAPKPNPMANIPVHRRPGAWGFFDDEFGESKSTQNREPVPDVFQKTFENTSESHLDPAPKLEITFNEPEPAGIAGEGTLFTFNTVSVYENTLTQPDRDHGFNEQKTKTASDGLVDITFNKLDTMISAVDPVAKTVGSAVVETSDAIFDIFKQIGGVGEYAAKPAPTKETSHKKADEEKKKQELKMRIQQFQMQAQSEKQAAQISQRAKVENTMARLGISQQEVQMKAASGNMNYEGAVTISNIFWVAANRMRRAAKKMMPAAGRGKSNGLQLNSSAQEGQSLVSSSGSIASAG